MVPYGIFFLSVPTQKMLESASLSASESPDPRRGGGDWLLLPVTFFVIQSMIGCSTCRLFFSTIIMWPLPLMPRPPSRNSSACTPACLRKATPPGLPGDANDESAVTNTTFVL